MRVVRVNQNNKDASQKTKTKSSKTSKRSVELSNYSRCNPLMGLSPRLTPFTLHIVISSILFKIILFKAAFMKSKTPAKHNMQLLANLNPVISPTLTYTVVITTSHFLTLSGIRLDGAFSPLGELKGWYSFGMV